MAAPDPPPDGVVSAVMRVLEAPVIWILVAVVLVALAALFIVTASMRRSRARRRAVAWDPAAALEPSGAARPAPAPSAPGSSAADRSAAGSTRRPGSDPEPVTVPLDLSTARGLAAGPPAPSAAGPAGSPPRPEDGTKDESSGQDDKVAAVPEGGTERSPEPAGVPVASAEVPRDGPEDGVRREVPAEEVRPPEVPADREIPEDEVSHEVHEREGAEDDSLVAPLFRPWSMQTRDDGRFSGAHPRHAVDHEPAAPVPSSDEADAGVPAGATNAMTDGRADDVAATPPANQDPAPATPTGDEAAKDKLLAVLLRDPAAALRALSAGSGSQGGTGSTSGESDPDPDAARGAAATGLLRAGLTPAQAATLIGVGESELAAVVARGLGLIGGGQGVAGRSRTEEPGRSWANAASSPEATTPTTG